MRTKIESAKTTRETPQPGDFFHLRNDSKVYVRILPRAPAHYSGAERAELAETFQALPISVTGSPFEPARMRPFEGTEEFIILRWHSTLPETGELLFYPVNE